MKHDATSLRRRHLLIAGLAGAAAPATILAWRGSGTPQDAPAVAELSASGGAAGEKLVISGRILRPDRKPLAGATVEAWHAEATEERASVATDADGRFMFVTDMPAGDPGRPRPILYRVSHNGREMLATQLHFRREAGVPGDRVARLQRDETGAWRAAFGVTLA